MLEIAKELSLPHAAVTEKLAFLGRTGSGKTYAAQKLAELFDAAGAQFVCLDPVGKWWSLRLAANGRDKGLQIPVFGGLQGDVPIEPRAGAIVADVIVDRGLSAVVDVSQFEFDTDKARFVTDFGARLFFRKKSEMSPSPIHIFVDEAQEFVPQNPQKEETRMLHVWTRIQKLGRNFGIGSSLLSQRPQDVNKKALNQAELLFAFQLSAPQERKAVVDWIKEKGINEDIEDELKRLQPGHPRAWSPSWLQISKIVSINKKWTYDASRTPKLGEKPRQANPLSKLEIGELGKAIQETIEKAKASDPKELQAKIRQLENELLLKNSLPKLAPNLAAKVKGFTEKQVHDLVQEERRERDRHWLGQVKLFQEQGRRLHERIARAGKALGFDDSFSESEVLQITYPQDAVPTLPAEINGEPLPRSERVAEIQPFPMPSMLKKAAARADTNGKLGSGERQVLQCAIQFPDGVTRTQLTVLLGFKRSTRNTYVHRLRQAGYVEEVGERVVPTLQGRELLGDSVPPLPTGSDLRAHWLSPGTLPEGEQKILSLLMAEYPRSLPRESFDEPTGFARSTRNTYIHRLKARELVLTSGQSLVQASPHLFEE
jgi:hypothetical protein